jgi:hypothetical protein
MSIELNGTTGITTPAETVSGAVTAATVTATGLISGATNYTGFKNRIINGNMAIDQRNAGAIVSAPTNGQYITDRWALYNNPAATKITAQQSSTVPTGFSKSLVMTSTSAYTVGASEYYFLNQAIEGFNISDLAWGTASASTVTLSFWVRSSLTGTFGGSIYNSAGDRSYPYSYTISVANTWEQKSVTIAGDTSGTWLTTNGVGIGVAFSLGVGTTRSGTANAWASGTTLYSATGATSVVGTNGATFYITGVQLEKGSTVTSFDYRPYGTELALCQRYYQRIAPTTAYTDMAYGYCYSTTDTLLGIFFRTSMRASPSALETTGTAANYAIAHLGLNTACVSVPSFASATTELINIVGNVGSGLTVGAGGSLRSSAGVTTAYLAWSVEL